MRRHSAAHLSNPEIKQSLLVEVRENCVSEAGVLVLIGEADARKMYLDEGFPSMYAWCVEFFHFSKEVAFRRIHAARIAREFPLLFAAVEDGRLHLSAVRLIAPHLTPENVDEIVAAATHRTCEQIEEMLARRFVRLETLLDGSGQLAASTTPVATPPPSSFTPTPSASTEVALMAPPLATRPATPAKHAVSTPAPEPRVAVTLDKRVHEKLQYARALLSHSLPLGSESQVIERALDDLIAKAERAKFGATSRPQKPRESQRSRCIPAHVRRAVWEACGGQCVIVGDNGKRCGTRKFLEFDHIVPVARGGKSTVENLRLVCRGHNQLAAERALGAGFMQRKREEKKPVPSFRDDVIAGLRTLGVSAREAQIVVERSAALKQPTLEESMRAALKCLGPRRRTSG
jgi:5-methylcytosine-specific restriction endonuclease McrA